MRLNFKCIYQNLFQKDFRYKRFTKPQFVYVCYAVSVPLSWIERC